jgi:hypothetical protein
VTAREQEEYRALRATIRERGTARVCLFVVGLLAWAAVSVATAALASAPVATFVPLLVLAATFEAVLALHVGVERLGRYVQVFFETDGPGWEHAAMSFGRPAGAIAIDPLFSAPFAFAALLNAVPILGMSPVGVELAVVGVGHLLFIARVLTARLAARKQRAIDLARFQELKANRRER